MSISVQLVIAALIFAAGAASGVKWQVGIVAARDLKATQQAARSQILRLDKVDSAAVAHEQVKVAVQIREKIVMQEVERVVEKPIYRNVCLDDDGLRIIAADINSRAIAGKPTPAVSGVTGTQ